MMETTKRITHYLAKQLQSVSGVNAVLGDRRQNSNSGPEDVRLITTQNIAPELMERANQALYPSILVYCEKLSNTLHEKFRTFAGTARLTVELRNSDDRLETLDSTLEYADVICDVLNGLRGEWTDGVFYAGGYEVNYSAVKTGGKHFVQVAKVTFEVSVSK